MVLEHVSHLRSDQLGILAKDLGPVEICESIGEALCPGHVLNPEKDIVVLGITNAIGLQLAR